MNDNEYIEMLDRKLADLREAIQNDIEDYKEAINEYPADIFFHSIQELELVKDNKEGKP